ncbi:MAG: type II toxin-antitoxin system RelE/ParE family toxin [Nitrosomonas sp.]|nr:type II toxin-antitoxin system RelE/ParE family toxin [Nitrosomonas sp.]
MRRVFLTRTFARWMRKAGLSNDAICQAVSEMAQGLIDADLGGNVVKKRIGLPGQGKRGGARTIVATKMADRWFFLYGFGKNERANIDKDELKVLQEVAKELLELKDRQLAVALTAGEIMEVCNDNDKA